MEQRTKIIATDEGNIDLESHQWDDQRFSEMLTRKSAVGAEQAKGISRFMREAIDELNIRHISQPLIDELLTAKLNECGVSTPPTIPLDRSIFIRNGLHLTQNAQTVLERRYLRKDDHGRPIETPVDMFRRVARHIAQADAIYDKEADLTATEESFYDLLTECRFLPNSPTLMNAGRSLGQLAACFVLPVKDSMEDIFTSLRDAAIIHKSGGGTGFSFSRLRPKNSMVGTTGGIASGPVSFMKIFNTATEQVKQGGTRRGANMAILRVDHPDILEFITCKKDHGDLNNFNISVGLSETFMQAVRSGRNYDLIDPRTGARAGELDAREVYTALVGHAWENGDPGIIFLDRINRDNPTPAIGDIESTNPCGEQPLLPHEACNLGSINLARFVTTDTPGGAAIDYPALGETVRRAVHFLDNTIDMSRYPLPEIDAMVKGNRKIGLGVMGFADLLFRLGIPYDSEEALETAEAVMSFVQKESHGASASLAETRGAFGNYQQSVYSENNGGPLRNATTTTIAPTGTLSIIANCSSGIEPLFALSFVRNVMDDDRLLEVNPWFEAVAKERGFYSESFMETVAQTGSVRHMDNIPEDVRAVFATAHDISAEWHVRMQAAFQKHTDNAVSKTVNLPNEATREDVLKVYDLAYELECKGVTIYRDGSKANQVLSVSGREKDAENRLLTAVRGRPDTLGGIYHPH